MDTHSSILASRILWTEEPGGLQTFEGLLPVLLQSPLAVLHSTQPHMPTEHTLVTRPQVEGDLQVCGADHEYIFSCSQWNNKRER